MGKVVSHEQLMTTRGLADHIQEVRPAKGANKNARPGREGTTGDAPGGPAGDAPV